MADPEVQARIRTYEVSDRNVVQYALGHSIMEQLALANRQVYMHPLLLACWIASAAAMISFLGWFPDPDRGWLGYLQPIPAFGAMAVPLLFAVDWFNRTDFEQEVYNTLHRPDVADLMSYYSLPRASALWIFELQGKVIGILGVDASSHARKSRLPLLGTEDANYILADLKNLRRDTSDRSAQSSEALIRHFWIDEQYRPADIQNDMLDHAVEHANKLGISKFRVWISPLESYKAKCLKKAGFSSVPDAKSTPLGVLGWRTRMLEMQCVNRVVGES